MSASGALLLLRRKSFFFRNLGQGQVTRAHDLTKLSALGFFRRRCCSYSSASSQFIRHASTYTDDDAYYHSELYGSYPKGSPCAAAAAAADADDVGLSSQEPEYSVAFTIKRKLRSFILGTGACFGAAAFMCRKPWGVKGYGWRHAYYSALARYDVGILLLRADVTISWRLLLKLFHGNNLSRRERHLLLQTTADIFITVPAARYLVLPSFDLLFPVLTRLFPNVLLPSTLEDKMTGQEPEIRKRKARKVVVKFLSDTASKMVYLHKNLHSGDGQPTAENFFNFITRVARHRPVTIEEILGFARLFTDELTLDNFSRGWLVIMCKFMGITPLGTDGYLRFILQERLELIKHDDKLIQAKGVDSLSEDELCKVCRERGIYVAEEMPHAAKEMRQQLRNWLDLSLNHSVPSSFLIISRLYIVAGNLNVKPLEAFLATLHSFSHEYMLIVGVTSLPSNNPIEGKLKKLQYLDLQEECIKEEEKKELSEMKQSDPVQDDLALQELTISMPEQARARAIDHQENFFKPLSNAITVLSSALNVYTECEKISRLVTEEDVAMLQNLEKEIADVDAKTGGHWQVLDRYCDGKVSLDVVTAATFLKDTLDKDGIQEHLSNLLKYKDEIVKLGIGAENFNQGQNQLVGASPPIDN